MRGSAASRTGVAPGGALAGPWVSNPLWSAARALPSLDLRFAESKSLTDAASGQSLVTFTRASSGTYVGSDGVLKTATTNLLLRSEEFETTWSTGDASITPGTTTAPNGTNTADKLVENNLNAQHNVRQAFTASNITLTFSVYVKAAERSRVFLQISNNATGAGGVIFNLLSGTAGTPINAGDFTSTTGTIVAVGNGWFRCSITTNKGSANTTAWPYVSTVDNNNAVNYIGDGTSGIYLWGAQLEQSSTVGEYIPTTSTINSAPRFDHNPTTGESLGLLVEESRTNLILYSEEFDNASWSKVNLNGTLTTNQTTAPDGLITAELYQEDTATSGRYISRQVSFVSGTLYTVSYWAKQAPGATRYAGLIFPSGAFGTNVAASFTLSGAGSVTIAASGTSTSASVQAFANGWYRCSLTSQATSTITANPQFRLSNSATAVPSYTGDGSSGLYIWGAQLEAGAFSTSYIPTTGTTATRSADVASITGTNFSSWYSQSEGTVFADATVLSTSKANQTISFNDSTLNNRFELRLIGAADTYRTDCVAGGVTKFSNQNFASSGTRRIAALAVKANDFRLQSGASGISPASDAVPAVDRLYLNYATFAGGEINGTIRRLCYWGQRLPNSTLQQITQ